MLRSAIVNDAPDDILDVAVVGGGVAGAYSAWRLLCDGASPDRRRLKLAIFEGSDRIGGRLLSLRPPGMDRLVCELGGMYFVSEHPMVCSLTSKLGLDVQPVPLAKYDLYYLRGKRLGPDLKEVPYNFPPSERAIPPQQLLCTAVEKLLPGIMKLSGDALWKALRSAVVGGLPLADWGFWNLLYLAMSGEAFAFTHDSTPDDFMFMNWNAVDAIQAMLLTGPGTKVFHVTDGYDRIPHTLAAEAAKAGCEIHLRHRLHSFEKTPDGLFELRLACNGDGWGPAGGGELRVVRARRLILAMPKRSLELILQTGPLFESAEAQKLIASVTSIPMFKMFSCYAKPWWKDLKFEANGVAITDLPLHTCLYWGTEGDQPGGDPKNTNSLLLTALDALGAASFWAGLRDPHHGEAFQTRSPPKLFGHEGSPEWNRYADCTTDRIVREAQRQLSEVHGIDVPEPYTVASKDWSKDPFGGAGSYWNVNVRSDEVVHRMTQPIDGLAVHVCGETYSHNQGWVEGALETTELMLEKHFGLAPPAWLKKSQ